MFGVLECGSWEVKGRTFSSVCREESIKYCSFVCWSVLTCEFCSSYRKGCNSKVQYNTRCETMGWWNRWSVLLCVSLCHRPCVSYLSISPVCLLFRYEGSREDGSEYWKRRSGLGNMCVTIVLWNNRIFTLKSALQTTVHQLTVYSTKCSLYNMLSFVLRLATKLLVMLPISPYHS